MIHRWRNLLSTSGHIRTPLCAKWDWVTDIFDMLGPWREMFAQGLTTWAEWSGPDARSDCHAWGASPNYELLRTVAGIESLAPGFHRVRIAPNLGKLEHISATMPHPKGEIRVDLERRGSKLVADVELPSGITGNFEWLGRSVALKPGKNHLGVVMQRPLCYRGKICSRSVSKSMRRFCSYEMFPRCEAWAERWPISTSPLGRPLVFKHSTKLFTCS